MSRTFEHTAQKILSITKLSAIGYTISTLFALSLIFTAVSIYYIYNFKFLINAFSILLSLNFFFLIILLIVSTIINWFLFFELKKIIRQERVLQPDERYVEELSFEDKKAVAEALMFINSEYDKFDK